MAGVVAAKMKAKKLREEEEEVGFKMRKIFELLGLTFY